MFQESNTYLRQHFYDLLAISNTKNKQYTRKTITFLENLDFLKCSMISRLSDTQV